MQKAILGSATRSEFPAFLTEYYSINEFEFLFQKKLKEIDATITFERDVSLSDLNASNSGLRLT